MRELEYDRQELRHLTWRLHAGIRFPRRAPLPEGRAPEILRKRLPRRQPARGRNARSEHQSKSALPASLDPFSLLGFVQRSASPTALHAAAIRGFPHAPFGSSGSEYSDPALTGIDDRRRAGGIRPRNRLRAAAPRTGSRVEKAPAARPGLRLQYGNPEGQALQRAKTLRSPASLCPWNNSP